MYDRKAVSVSSNIEVLVHASGAGAEVKWVCAANGEVPPNAVGPSGKGLDQTYVGRSMFNEADFSGTPGKVHPVYKSLFLAGGNKERRQYMYEVCVISHGIVCEKEKKNYQVQQQMLGQEWQQPEDQLNYEQTKQIEQHIQKLTDF